MSQESPKGAMVGFDPTPMFQKTPALYPGTADLFVGGDEGEFLARTTWCYFRYRSAEKKRYFEGITVIAPPRAAWDKSDEDIYAMVLAGFSDMEGRALAPDEQRIIAFQVTIRRCEGLDLPEVLAQVKLTARRNVILVPTASRYRDPTCLPDATPSRIRVLLAEDVWVPHVCRLAAGCLSLAEATGSVIIFHAPEEPLAKKANIKALNDVEGLYPMLEQLDEDLQTLQSELIPRWVALGASGRATQALEEIASHSMDESVRRMVEVMVYAKAGDNARTQELLAGFLPMLQDMPGNVAARLGRIAYQMQDLATAEQCYAHAVTSMTDQAALENSLDVEARSELTRGARAELTHP